MGGAGGGDRCRGRGESSTGISVALSPLPEAVMAKRKAAKRELIKTGSDKRFVRRGAKGKFKESDDVGRSLAKDPKTKAKRKAPKAQGDRGDR